MTAAGATLALALMFLKTNNATVASRLAVPKTHFLLQYLRPDLVLLRVLARNLVMWDAIEPTVEFVEDLIPEIVKGAYHTNANIDSKGERERDNARYATYLQTMVGVLLRYATYLHTISMSTALPDIAFVPGKQ